jgi:hypothetical protein
LGNIQAPSPKGEREGERRTSYPSLKELGMVNLLLPKEKEEEIPFFLRGLGVISLLLPKERETFYSSLRHLRNKHLKDIKA